jgi:hypothetical protein
MENKHCNPTGYEMAVRAMHSLQMYRKHYASGQKFQERFQEILSMLRKVAEDSNSIGEKKFLFGFADALEQANKGGEYVPPVFERK